MADPSQAEVELQRCVDRLRTMPLTRLTHAAPLAYDACRQLLATVDDGTTLPRLADHAAGDQLAVIGTEVLHTPDAPVDVIASILVELRRTLP